MLAPYGLAGVLTGVSYRSSTDHATRKLMEEWRQYYPVECGSNNNPTATGAGAGQQQRGPGPGGGQGGLESASETEDMVEVIVGNVRMRYPTCYVMVCDADSAANSAAFNQLATSEGGMLMTPPASPPLVSNPASISRSISHSSAVSSTLSTASAHHSTQQQLISTVPSCTADALNKIAQAAHSWRPEEARRLAEQAWQDTLLAPVGLLPQPKSTSVDPTAVVLSSSPATTIATPTNEKDSTANLWDFLDPTIKNSCICVKSRRNKTGSNSQGNSVSTNSNAKMATTATMISSSSSSSSSSVPSSSSSSSSSSGKRGGGVPFHHRPSCPAPARAHTAVAGVGQKLLPDNNATAALTPGGLGSVDGVQDRVNRAGMTNTTSTSGATTPAPAPALPTYQRSQAALRGPLSQQSQQQQHSNHGMNSSGNNNSVGPFTLASPASVAPPTPHSHAPPSVPPMDSSLTLSSPHPPASNDPSSNFIPSTPSAIDHNSTSQDQNCSRATPGGAAHTPGGGPKSNQASSAYSPYVALPSVDTPGWPHSAGGGGGSCHATQPRSSGGQQPASCGPPTSMAPTTPNVGGGANGGGSTCSTADLFGIKKIVLPQKDYEDELKEGETAPGLLYDYSSMTAWLFHPVKRMKLGKNSQTPNGDRPADSFDGSASSGKHMNGNLMLDMEVRDSADYDEDGGHNGQSRKRKEPDSCRDEDSNSLNSANAAGGAAKPVNPSSLFTSEGLQASYQDLDKIFDNSDESNDTCPVPTPPGSNKPAGLPEDTALMGHGHHKPPRGGIAAAHPSPGTTMLGGHHLTAGGVNILASAEFSNMFPTPPSHEHPMQSPCGQMEGSVDLMNIDMNNSGHNGIKSEPGSGNSLNGCSPTYLQEDSVNKDWSYVYRPPTVWKVANSSKYAPLPMLPSQTMSPLFLPAPYRPSVNSNSSANHSSGIVDMPRGPMMHQHASIRPFQRLPPMIPPMQQHFPRGGGPAPFSPISPSPYGGLDGIPPSFGGMSGHGPLQRPAMNMGGFPPHGTLKQLLQHQQGQIQSPGFLQHPPGFPHHHPPQQQLQLQIQQQQQQQHQHQPQQVNNVNNHSNLPECHSLMVNIVLGDSMLNIFRDHNFDSCTVCVCSDGQNWVGTIRGQDAVFYLPESSNPRSSSRALTNSSHYPGMGHGGGPGSSLGLAPPPPNNHEEESCRCNCGFSAIVNRHLAHQAGLFYEDELEIVGVQATQDPGQFKRGSLYAVCHSTDKQEQQMLTRSRMLECGPGVSLYGSDNNSKALGGKGCEKEAVDKGDIISQSIAAVVMEASAPLVDTLPVSLMELLREQCLLLHHSSSPLYRAEQLQAATRKASLLHALDYSDGCETARNALTLALYNNSPMPMASPVHQQQAPPPPYQQPQQQQQQQQHWNNGPQTPNPYGGMPFNQGMGGFQAGGPVGAGGPGYQGPSPGNMHHPMSPSLHSPTMPVRGRPSTPASAVVGGMPLPMTSPVGMAMQQRQPHPSHGIMAHSTPYSSSPSAATNGPIVHYWPFLHVQGPNSSQDVIRVMRTLQPLLQDSIQKKRAAAATLWRAPFAVQGPLTWRQFHRMAVRGTEDRCEPQPIPSVMAGFDRDWVAIAPLAIPHWDRLLLEPYSRQRDVAYIVLAPEVDYVLSRTKAFFKELSSTYEMCRFGRHVPYKGLRDGILRVGKSAAAKLANEGHPVDEWFSNIGDSPIASLLRLYAKVCRYHLAPTLINMPMDRTLLDPPAPPTSSRPMQAVPSPMAPPSTTPIHSGDYSGSINQSGMGPPNSGGSNSLQGSSSTFGVHHSSAPSSAMASVDGKPTSPKTEDGADGTSGHGASGANDASAAVDDEDMEPPSVVIYIVDPFSFGSDNLDLGRLTALGLLRCYHQMLSLLSETIQLNVSLQLISADAILQLGKDLNGASRYDSLRSLALNVFSQCKKLISQPSNVKSLTGFGPAAASDTFLKAKDEKNRAPYRVYIPAYVLAPAKDRTVCDLDPGVSTNGGPGSGPLSFLARPDKYSVLYVSYCLSEDQRWLIAACTDERGELVDSCTIGIDVPNRTKRKRVSVRRFGLQRLMDFILGVISTGVHPWRLVIGRVGRMGHGELKSWSALLSRKNLLRASRHLADICGQCSLVFPSQAPTLVSACLVSLEPDSHFRMMPDQVTPDERFGQQSANSHLSTPEDASCTHILVFPTSATTRSPQTTFHEENINGPDLGDDDLLSALNDDMGDGFEGMSGFDDIFMTWPETDQVNDGTDDLTSDITGGNSGGMNNMGGCGASRSPGASHGGVGGGSPGRGGMRSNMNPESPSGMGGHHAGGSGRQSPRAEQEEVGTLLQQPLALGYYVSTAPTGDMPSWFWSSCPHLARACPAFLKCALHLHNHAVQQSSDDLLLQQQQQQVNNSSKVHPLDSQVTTDVLRYVMEGYNALSWLSLDPKSRDRRSCLPIHIQLLVQLYHALAALV